MEDFDFEELEEAMENGMIECECCGDMIELDGTCPDGTPSKFLELGLI